MIVVDKSVLTQLSKAFRRELVAIGIPIGYQTSMNACIFALGVGNPNKALATISSRPLVVGAPGGTDTDISPSAVVAQLARLAGFEAGKRSAAWAKEAPSANSSKLFGGADMRPLTREDLACLIAAACVAGRISVGKPGEERGLKLSRSSEALSMESAYMLDVMDGPHEELDALDLRPHALALRAASAISKLPLPGPMETKEVAGAFSRALGSTVLSGSPNSSRCDFNSTIRAIAGDTWSGDGWWGSTLLEMGPRSALSWLAEVVLNRMREPLQIGIRWPDGRMTGWNESSVASEEVSMRGIPLIKVKVAPDSGKTEITIEAALAALKQAGGVNAECYRFVYRRESYDAYSRILTNLYQAMGVREIPRFRWSAGMAPTLNEHLNHVDLRKVPNPNFKILHLNFGDDQPDIEFMALVERSMDVVQVLSRAGLTASSEDVMSLLPNAGLSLLETGTGEVEGLLRAATGPSR